MAFIRPALAIRKNLQRQDTANYRWLTDKVKGGESYLYSYIALKVWNWLKCEILTDPDK